MVPDHLLDFNASGNTVDHAMTHGRADSIGEFRGIREYRHGDPLKFIPWPLSLRYGQAVVREYQPTGPDHCVVLFHDYAPRGKHFDQAAAERALQLLSGIFVWLARSGISFSFMAPFTNWERIELNGHQRVPTDALESLIAPRIGGSVHPSSMQAALDTIAMDQARVLVVSPTNLEHWQDAISQQTIRCMDSEESVRHIAATA
jgi:uncharacterized protein (DUF58 family)